MSNGGRDPRGGGSGEAGRGPRAPGSLLDAVCRLDLDLRDTVILLQAGIEYHVNRIMLKRFGTSSFESGRMNAKAMALDDAGVIDGRLRQDLIQVARIRHLFARSLDVDEGRFLGMLKEIGRGGTTDPGLRARFLSAVGPVYEEIRGKDEGLPHQPGPVLGED